METLRLSSSSEDVLDEDAEEYESRFRLEEEEALRMGGAFDSDAGGGGLADHKYRK